MSNLRIAVVSSVRANSQCTTGTRRNSSTAPDPRDSGTAPTVSSGAKRELLRVVFPLRC
jgi:hypothetical protein